jgi:hypothetical protein
MRRIDEQEWIALQQALTTTVAARVPEWTEGQSHDPGIAILQLVAFLVEDLATRGPLREGAAPWISRTVDALNHVDDGSAIQVSVGGERWEFLRSLADASRDATVFSVDDHGAVVFGDGEHGRRPPSGSRITARFRDGGGEQGSVTARTTWPFEGRVYSVVLGVEGTVRFAATAVASESWSGMKRPRYFDGRLLTADDLDDEQSYLLTKHRRHQRALHGSGVVNGLQVQGTGTGDSVTIRAGCALDREGREIYVNGDLLVTVPAGTPSPAHVVVEYAERATDPVPTSGEGEVVPTRIEEGCRVLLENGSAHDGIPIARLIGATDGWKVDATFVPPRVR